MVHMLGIAKIYGIMGRRLLENIHKSSIDGWIFTEMVSLLFAIVGSKY